MALAACSLAGCFLFSGNGKSMWSPRTRLADAVSGPDVVYMEVAPLIAPLGDRYVNEELWTAADEQILSSVQRAKLEENGLRVGLINGRTPDTFLALLTSKKSNPDAVRAYRKCGTSFKVGLASKIAVCEFPLYVDGEVRKQRFEQAAGQLQLTPALDNDGKVRLEIVPQVEYRDPNKWSHLNPALALSVQGLRSTESFPALGWDVSLAPNEWVVIGARYEKPQSLAFQLFVTPDQDRPIQRLVAVRAGRTAPAAASESSPNGNPSRTPSLASQAAGK